MVVRRDGEGHDDRRSLLENCRLSASDFLLSDAEARDLIASQTATIRARWVAVCDDAELSEVDRAFLWRRQFLNEYAFDGYADGAPADL